MKLLRRLAILLLALAATRGLAGEAPRVVVSIKPVHSLVAGLMQGVAEPRLLIEGTTPLADLRLDADQQAALSAADLIIWTGPELEPGLQQPLQRLEDKPLTIELLASDELKILPRRGDSDSRDAYFWLDSRNMLMLLDELTRVLSRMDPENAPRYTRNRSRMLAPIADLDRKMEFSYREVSGVPVFFYHDTHQYFEQAYAMNVYGTVARPPGARGVRAAGLLALKKWLSEVRHPCLFTEASLAEPHLDMLLAGTAVTPVELDSIGATLAPGPDLYERMMRRNFAAISECVRQGKSPRADQQAMQTDAPDVRRFPDKVIPRYALMNQFGQTVSNEDFHGRFQLIYFGYTYCPDICPTSLASAAQAMELLGPLAKQVQPIFITVDPQRDTPQVLARYVAYFHPDMLGLSGSPAMTKRTAEHFKARFEKVPADDGDPQRYSMDHTASLYLLGRDGAFITKFAHGLPAEEVARRLREYITRSR